MRALVFNGPHDLAVANRPDPVPVPGEALLEVLATGICGSDLHGYTGENGRRHPGQVMGHETVARVAALGPDTEGPGIGSWVTVNPVIGDGACAACAAGTPQRCENRRVIGVDPTYSSAFAEFMTAPTANLVALPDGAPPEIGSLVEPLAVGYHAARRGGVGPADAVLVVGAGPIGQAAALAAERLGCGSVLVSEVDDARRAAAEALGFATVDPRAGDVGRAVRARFGRAATVALDAVGTAATVTDSLSSCGLGGTVVLVGMGVPELSLKAYDVSTAERSVVGSFCYDVDEFRDTAVWAAGHARALQGLVDGRVGLDDAPEAFRALATGELRASKILVFPHGAPETAR